VTTRLEDAPLVTDDGSNMEEGMWHTICLCTPGIAYCGTELAGDIDESIEASECMVCLDFTERKARCRFCGLVPE
jgi:hypothetical protein